MCGLSWRVAARGRPPWLRGGIRPARVRRALVSSDFRPAEVREVPFPALEPSGRRRTGRADDGCRSEVETHAQIALTRWRHSNFLPTLEWPGQLMDQGMGGLARAYIVQSEKRQ